MSEDKRRDSFNDLYIKEISVKNTEELSERGRKNAQEDFFTIKVRYRCADCDWSSRWGGRSELKATLEKHTRDTGHEYFFTDSSKED